MFRFPVRLRQTGKRNRAPLPGDVSRRCCARIAIRHRASQSNPSIAIKSNFFAEARSLPNGSRARIPERWLPTAANSATAME